MEDDHDQRTVRAGAGGRSHGPACNPGSGTDSTAGLGQAPAPQANGGDLQLAPIPHLDALRWLNTGARGPKVDTLMDPELHTLGPFLLEPEIPSASFRKQARTDHSGASDFSEITGSTAQGETDCDQRQKKR